MSKSLATLLLFAAGWGSLEACELKKIESKWDLWRGALCLRGANIWQKRIEPGDDVSAIGPGPLGPPYSVDGLKQLAGWGANFINISHPGIFTQGRPYALDHAAKQNLDRLIAMAAEADLFVVIGFRTGPGRSEKAFTDQGGKKDHLVWKNKKAQDAWVQMWKQTAKLYKNHPNVIGYELMVEPNSNGALLNIYDPEPFFAKYKDTLYNWYPLAERIVSAVRGEDSVTPILVGGMNWSSVNWLDSIPEFSDPRIVYVAHQYEPFVYTHQKGTLARQYPGFFDGDYDGTPDYVNKSFLATLMDPVQHFKEKRGAPVTVNEFGLIRYEPGADKFINDHFELFEQWQVSSAIWIWESDFKGIDWNEFNFRFGNDIAATSEVSNSPLEKVIRAAWSKNSARPSKLQKKW
ncbi:MAG: cellulase family glycosylhydrolase [Bdellovibrionaceae bacterium]|nr:cellulase family glycosylhydrolase [Bdellovibrionales bacterium]MCB9255097.1 cellulase family glycosylhydrolase [Pseudobdellovibrionaceae bacterium]